METIQMLGFGSFIAASFVLGVRLLLLWRRTGEPPELMMGASFLVGGGLGYSAWFGRTLYRMGGATMDEAHLLGIVAQALTCAGALTIAIGTRLIFRPAEARALAFVGLLATGMLSGLAVYAWLPAEGGNGAFWVSMWSVGAAYGWAAFECLRLHDVLRKRARVGLASPLLADRARLWAFAFGAVLCMVTISFLEFIVSGNDGGSAWVSTLQSMFGLVCAGAIWLGFFPPAAYRERFATRGPAAGEVAST